MSWDSRNFLIFLVMVGWKDTVKNAVVAFKNCLLNCLLGFSSFCLTLSMMCQGCLFCKEVV